MNIRLATDDDIEKLIQMRLDFTLEYNSKLEITDKVYADYHSEIKGFLKKAINSQQWFIWVAEDENIVVSHIYLELINKVPRPGKKTNPFVYMTNVYTLPSFRGQGIGSTLLTQIKEWAAENEYEFIMVWPSENSVEFYQRNDYIHCKEPMELMLE
ncbi:putative N-acetyltransferase YhbS [Paenibacillus cellulosilyticus]|uniref:Putative N-acetyltransferase YhbS n=1 Tax=Paenibacillus cellulosilyticus TaxID=375489 RepID=A0A2V2YPV0_9BACL|nr:GNAT family N-acetyltransferase [Paenibacillus cellulosilyticus]PWV94471.1 putative N-acetyltransferase YhbS [Paenibacillus cellulosilyticus]QKS44988.1 GNAT family N-acetyltransferase [Paenibacillus cellulosilyticus]